MFGASYPIYSFFLPVYAFWCMDEFSWGNTRVVIGEGKDKKVITNDDEKFDDSMIPVKKFSGVCSFSFIILSHPFGPQNTRQKHGKLELDTRKIQDMTASLGRDLIPDHGLRHPTRPTTMHQTVATTTAIPI
jgi:hypothetical protein